MNAGKSKGKPRRRQAPKFLPATDHRGRPVRGLCTRNGRFYAALWVPREGGGKYVRRFPLRDESGEPARTLAAARAALDGLRASRHANALPSEGRKPGFDSFAGEYLGMAATRAKRAGTLENETQALARWRALLGSCRLDQIGTPAISRFIELRRKGGRIGKRDFKPASARTAKLDLIALRNVLRAALEAGHLAALPRFPKIKAPPPPRRQLLTPAQFEALLAACLARGPGGAPVTKNGEQLRDFLRLLAYSGAREQEALCIKWAHVDFAAGRLYVGAPPEFEASAVTIGAGGESKNRGSRVVEFNPQLEALLAEMRERRPPDSSWLFPSPQRGERDARAMSLRESLKLARAAAGLPEVGFHDLRHFFCSFCVMTGIDFMTIAGWLGHKDGGILVGKVYGHLLDAHRKEMAAKLTIGIAPLQLQPKTRHAKDHQGNSL